MKDNYKYKLIINNIQGIKSAIIYIDKMTGIVGDNNLGKSTINKILYSLIKAKIEMEFNEDDNYTNGLIDRFFQNEDQKNKISKYISGDSKIQLNNEEEKIAENIINLVGDLNSINKSTAFSTQLLTQLTEPIIRYGAEVGEIELYKGENLIYKVQLTKNEKLFSEKTVKTNNNLGFTEIYNNLKELNYKDVTYIELNDILTLYSVWGDILIDKNIKSSTKDTIRKLMKCTNLNHLKEDCLIYDKNLGLVYQAEGRFININSIGDGFKRLAQINTLINNGFITENTLLLLEEPEVGIHSNKIKELVKIFEALNNNNVDIIFTTHNSLLINYVLKKSNIHLATSKTDELFNAETIIKFTKDANEILSPYLKPLSELRESKFKSILERKNSNEDN